MRLLSDSTTVHSQLSLDEEEELFGQITFVIDLLKYNLVIMTVTVAVVIFSQDTRFRIYVLATNSRLARRIPCKVCNHTGYVIVCALKFIVCVHACRPTDWEYDIQCMCF